MAKPSPIHICQCIPVNRILLVCKILALVLWVCAVSRAAYVRPQHLNATRRMQKGGKPEGDLIPVTCYTWEAPRTGVHLLKVELLWLAMVLWHIRHHDAIR